MTRPLDVSRAQILAYRQTVGSLVDRLPAGAESLRCAAFAGLQDSMPRAALLSIHARVEGTEPTTWEDPALVQLWGPRFSAFVVAAGDRALFTLGRYPDGGHRRRFAEEMAEKVATLLDGRKMTYGDVGRALGVNHNAVRYAAPTGTILMRWHGARQPTIWSVPAPDIEPHEARLELARRYLHVYGPSTADAFGDWAGIKPAGARAAFDALESELVPVRTPIGEAWLLADDVPAIQAATAQPLTQDRGPVVARLLPSGDAYTLHQNPAEREMLVADRAKRDTLWTPRVWPGAILAGGELVGTWQRSQGNVTLRPWQRLSVAERAVIETEAISLPIPGVAGQVAISWDPG